MISELSKFPCVYLEDICNINIGKTPSRSNNSYWGKGFTWISISDMNGKEVLIDSKEEITELGLSESGIKIVKAGSLLFSFKLSIGKVAFAGKDLFTNEAIAAFEVKDTSEVDSKYLYYVLKEFDFTATGDKAVKGITLNKAKLKRLKIPLPPLSTQQQIARILDQADALRKKTQQVIDLYDQLAQSIFLDMFGDPVRNPKGWEMKTIESLVTKDKYSIKRGPFGGSLKKEIFVEDGYLVYEQYHALNNNFDFGRYYIDEYKYEELKSFAVKPGDIIISCSGVYLGKLAIIPEDAKKGIINQALLKLTLSQNEMRNVFFKFHFTQSNFRGKFFDANRGAGIPNFPPMSEFKKFPFVVPPITLQNQFAEKISLIEKQKELAKQSLQEGENLFNALLQKAFKGELVNSV